MRVHACMHDACSFAFSSQVLVEKVSKRDKDPEQALPNVWESGVIRQGPDKHGRYQVQLDGKPGNLVWTQEFAIGELYVVVVVVFWCRSCEL